MKLFILFSFSAKIAYPGGAAHVAAMSTAEEAECQTKILAVEMSQSATMIQMWVILRGRELAP